MKAVVFHEHGGPEVLRYEEIATPEPGPGEVLVRVGAATVNRGPDTMVRQGGFGLPGFRLPHVGGADAAGEVVELGEGAEGVEVGDRVVVYTILWCGTCEFCRAGRGENSCRNFRVIGVHTWGGHADYVAVPARNCVKLPDSVSFEQAATLAVSYVTTWHGMVTRARTGPGDTVLVMAAGSGVGAAAIQIGRMLGARVLATTGADWKQARAVEIGAEAAFNYNDPTWPDQVMEATDGLGASVVFDNVGGETWPRSLDVLGREGRLFCSGATGTFNVTLDLRRLYRNMNTLYFHMQGTKAELADVVGLVADGRIDPVIDRRYPLSEATAAQERLMAKEQFGKVVLVPDGAPAVASEGVGTGAGAQA